MDKNDTLTFFSVILGVSLAYVLSRLGTVIDLYKRGKVIRPKSYCIILLCFVFAHFQFWVSVGLRMGNPVPMYFFSLAVLFLVLLSVAVHNYCALDEPNQNRPYPLDLQAVFRDKRMPVYWMITAMVLIAIILNTVSFVVKWPNVPYYDYVAHACRFLLIYTAHKMFVVRDYVDQVRWSAYSFVLVAAISVAQIAHYAK
jgi:hypothetical protein